MGFSQEVRDFIGGYTAVTDVKQKKKSSELDEKRIDADIEYKNEYIDLMRQELEFKKQKHLDALAGANDRAAASAAKAADKQFAKDAAAAIEGGPSTNISYAGNPFVQVPEAVPAKFDLADYAKKYSYPTGGYARGGRVQKMADGGRVLSEDEIERWEKLADLIPEAALEEAAARRGPTTRGGKRGPEALPYWEKLADVLPEGALEAAAARRGPTTRVGKRDPEAPSRLDNLAEEWRGVPGAAADYAADVVGRVVDAIPDQVKETARDMAEKSQAAPILKPTTRGGKRGAGTALPEGTGADASSLGLEGMSGQKMEFPPRKTQLIYNRASEAAALALGGQEQQMQMGRAAVGPGSEIAVDIVTGEGAYTPEELKEIYKQIDPDGIVPAHLRTMANLSEYYTYFKNKGDMRSAYIASTRLLAAEKQLSQTLGMLAAEAMQNGHTEEAMKLFGDAFDRFPTDHNIELKTGPDGVMYYAVRQRGKIVDQGKLSGAEFMEMAGELANGKLFMQGLMQFAASNGPQQTQTKTLPREALAILNDAKETAVTYGRAVEARDALEGMVDTTEEQIAAADAAVDRAAVAANKARGRALDVVQQYLPENPDIDALAGALGKLGDPIGIPGGTDLPRPATAEEAAKLPPGTPYMAPDGTIWIKR